MTDATVAQARTQPAAARAVLADPLVALPPAGAAGPRAWARSVHGDPHAGNFLYDREGGRCRISDFETTLPCGMEAAQGRARDFAILALDLSGLGHGTSDGHATWRDAYGGSGEYCPIDRLFRSPGFRLRRYWQWLGYDPSGFAMRPSSAISGIVETGNNG